MLIFKRSLSYLFVMFFLFAATKVNAQVSSWSLAPSSILKNILKDIERDENRSDIILKLKEFITNYPYASITDEAILRLANIYLKENRIEEAKPLYQDILEGFPISNFKTEALYGLAYCQFRDGELRYARSNLKGLLSDYNTSVLLKAKAELLLADINSILTESEEGVQPIAIGVVLPLSGPYEQFGQEALKGILLATGTFGDEDPLEVVVKDSRGEPASAKRALEELSKDERVLGIVGPLLSKAALDTAKQAQKKKMPIISLSQVEKLPQIGEYIYRNSLTLSEQAWVMADYAMKTLECKTFVIFHPDNLYGRELTKIFKKAVLQGGGQILEIGSYTEGQTDFGDDLKALFKIEEEERLEGRRTIIDYTPTVIADAIYMPGYYDSIGLIAPQLTYYNINDIKMIGSNGWNSPKLVELGGEYIEGAFFVDGFFAGSNRPYTERFVRNFNKTYGQEPGIIEAQAFDSAKMLAQALKGDRYTRKDIKDRLIMFNSFEGATGTISFDTYGEAMKDLFILSIKNGKLVEVDDY